MNLPLLILVSVLKIAVVMGVLLTCVAYTVLLERKVLGFIQLRYGPNRVGPWGLFPVSYTHLTLPTNREV